MEDATFHYFPRISEGGCLLSAWQRGLSCPHKERTRFLLIVSLDFCLIKTTYECC